MGERTMRPALVAGLAVLLASLACTCEGEVTDAVPLPVTDAVTDTDAETDVPADGPGGGAGKRGKRGKKGKGGKGKAEEPAPIPEPEPAPGGGSEGPSPGIQYLGNDTWSLPRHLVDRYENNPGSLGCSAKEKGKGYEVFGAGPNDDGYALGARNGDLLMEVNGMPMDTMTQLMLMWTALDGEDKLHVKLVRAGATRTHHYNVVD